MKKSVCIIFLLLLFFPINAKAMTEEEKIYIKEILNIVNKERKSANLNEVILDEQLTNDAITRAKEIVTKFSHTRPNGTSCFTAITNKYSSAAENIAIGQQNSEEVMRAWMISKGHRENILNNNYKAIGIGVYKYNNIMYWVQIFTNTKYNELKIDNTVQNTQINPKIIENTDSANDIIFTRNKQVLYKIEINSNANNQVLNNAYLIYETYNKELSIDNLTYTSENENIFTISGNKIIPMKNGTANIIIRYNNHIKTIPVTINL